VLKPARTINYLLYTLVPPPHCGKFVKQTGWHIVVLFGPAFHFQEESGFNLSSGAGYHTFSCFSSSPQEEC
jgi:hypothetical protein